MAQALYRKWRSRTFNEVVGQEHVTQTLRNALRDGRVAHAYLFSGPRGTGKTSTARILAKALNCVASEEERPCDVCTNCRAISEGRMLDLIEIDAASNNSVDDIRELRDKVGFQPSEGRYKVYIIDEVHMLSTSAFNALLKTLEEPPPHARFVLATTEPHKIPATVVSRCQRFDFRRIPVPEIAEHLRHIAAEEGFGAEDAALTAIARSAQGCMRDAVSLLDQMTSYGTQQITLAQVQQVLGSVGVEAVSEFVDALAEKNIAGGLTLIQRLLLDGVSLQEFTTQVVEHLRGIMLLQMTGDKSLLIDQPLDDVAQMVRQAQILSKAQTLYAIKRFSEAVGELKGGIQPQLPLELALIEAVQGEMSAAPVQTVVQPTEVTAVTPTAQDTQPVQSRASDAKASPAAPDRTSKQVEAESDPPAPLDETAAQKLSDNWKDFLKIVRSECGYQVEGALNTMRDIAVSEHKVALAFGNNQFTRDMVARPDVSRQVAALLSKYLNRQIGLECQMGERARLSKSITVQTDVKGDDSDELIEYAVNELGATVVEE